MAELTKKERESLIGKISYKSGVTKMALSRLSDEQLTQAAKDLEAFANIKSAVTWMQHHQRTFTEVANLKTKEAESKLANFLNSENSEILNAGKWLLGALSKSGKERKQTLKEKELVHTEDANQVLDEYDSKVEDIMSKSQKQEALLQFIEIEIGNIKYRQIMRKFNQQ